MSNKCTGMISIDHKICQMHYALDLDEFALVCHLPVVHFAQMHSAPLHSDGFKWIQMDSDEFTPLNI